MSRDAIALVFVFALLLIFLGRCLDACVRVCHRKRTDNTPSAAHWLELFATHARRYGYSSEVARAESRLAFVTTRALLGAAS